MSKTGIGIDIGSRGVRVAVVSESKGTIRVQKLVQLPLAGDDEVDPAEIGAQLRDLLASEKVKGAATCGLTGRDVVLRYTQVPPVPDWQLRQLMEFEINEMASQSGEELSADFNLVPVASEMSNDDTVLLALAKPGIMASHRAVLDGAGLAVRAFTPNAIAIYNLYRTLEDATGTVLILNIGAKNSDIALAKDGDLVFARNLSGGGDLFDEALVASFNVGRAKARSLKEELADLSPPDSSSKKTLSAQEEKVSRSLAGASGQLLSMIQSSVMFARTQTGMKDLKLDKVLLCGGTARLIGLDRSLAANLDCAVELFDPFEKADVSGLEGELDPLTRATSVVALGLAVSAVAANAYSIEILPASVKRARAFRERTLFSILASLVIVGWLAWDAVTAKAAYERASADVRQFSAESEVRGKRERSFREEVDRSAVLTQKILALEEKVVAGTGAQRTLVLLQKHLPVDLFVTSVELTKSKDPELGLTGDAMKPVMIVKGEGRESAERIEETFNKFAEELGADPLLGRRPKTATAPASAKKAFEWSVTLNYSKTPPATEVDAGAEDGAKKPADGAAPGKAKR